MSFNIAPFLPKYVRSLHINGESPKIPFVRKQFGVVLMVDVCGFSQLTTLAAEQGNMGAETLALEIGEYFDECIRIIEFYGGDVVKFLGDAILVSFQSNISELSQTITVDSAESCKDPNDREPDHRTRYTHMHRAVQCGLQLLARLSHYRVYLTPAERSRHRAPEPPSPSAPDALEESGPDSAAGKSVVRKHGIEASLSMPGWNCIPFFKGNRAGEAGVLNIGRRKSSFGDGNETSAKEVKSVDLELHCALAAGEVINIIIGDNGDDDSSVEGSQSHKMLGHVGRLEYAICGEAVKSLDEALTIAKPGEMTITKAAWLYVDPTTLDLKAEIRRNCYIVCYHHHHLHHHHTGTRRRSRPDLSKLNTEPLIPRVRNTSFLETPGESNSHYFKYINRSAYHRLQDSVDGNFPAQFRDVTIMFVSYGDCVLNTEGVEVAQKVMMLAMEALKKYDGSIQQFAVDDKGATLLVVFGLPPYSHEREAIFAAKAALELRSLYLENDVPYFAISLSTGTIFHAVIPQGNEFRRDPAISGDTIVLAVRMLKFDFAFQDVVCDENTKRQVGQLCEFDDMGEQFVKGKAKPVRIYKVLRFASDASRKSSVSVSENVDFIGYKSEMDTTTSFINGWITAKNQHCVVVAGPSGAGKSYFCSTVQSIVSAEKVFLCIAQANEVEKGTKYYLVKFIMLHLFDILGQGVVPKAEACTPLSPTLHIDDSLSVRSIKSHQTPDYQKRFTQYAMFSPIQDPEVLGELVDLARRCLIICGEDESVLPLFKGLFPQFDIPESGFTCMLDVQTKEMLLANLVQRMIRYVSSQVDLMIFCDDIQWADTASANMLVSIHETCPRVFLLMASRPIKDYKVAFVGDINQSGTCLTITLSGLGSDEIGAIVLQTEGFKKGVSKISPQILRVIKERTGGNPLYVKNMALVLKDFDHVTVVEGELVPQNHAFDLENLIGNFDYKRVIRMQFDRLDSAFQEFLKIASCLDVNFTIAEVRTAISVNNPVFFTHDARQIDELLEQYDKYNYLVRVGDANPAERRVGELLGGGDVYTFAHVTIPQSIYDAIPYETRRRYHRSLARFYEARLREGNASNLLVKITRHYQETEDIPKQLRYLEMLADYHMKSYFLSEATAALKQIVKILEENEQHAKEYGRLHRSDIYQRLGECLSMRTDLDQGQSYLFKALECLGKPWPKTSIAFTFSIFKQRIEQQYRTKLRHHYHRYHTTAPVLEGSDAEIYRRVANIMHHLTNVHFYTGQGQDFILACLMGLNACERLGPSYPYHSTFLVRFALLCWVNDDQIAAISLLDRALRRGTSEPPDAITLCICSYICFAAGHLAPARDTLTRAIRLVRVCGVVTDCQAFYRAVSLSAAIGIFGGKGCDPGLMKVMAETAHTNGDYGAEIWLSLFHIAEGIVADDLRSCDPYVTLLEGHWEKTKGFDRIAVRGVLMAYYARLRRREVAMKHFEALAAVLPSLTVSANLIPVYGLIFATMALYELSEAGMLDAEAAVDPLFFERLIVNVRTLNAAFQHAKFWEFTKPCLYLARALPYICTGRTVEGSLVLCHGLMEMEFIHEIRFLKAYYWAKLGRYAFQAADRSTWTGHARAELTALGIPHEVYCGVSTAGVATERKEEDGH